MYQVRLAGLGVLPPLLLSLVMQMVKSRMTAIQISRALAIQFNEIKHANEAQLTELAVLLSENTDKEAWEWFSILRNARELGLIQTNVNGNGAPPEPEPEKDNKLLWIAGAVGAVILIAVIGGRK